MTSKQRCLSAIAGRPVDRVPVFPLLMFFAVDRAKITYRKYATDAAALADAQLNMRQRFGVDAITVCSDAFRLSADLGGQMDYPEMAPPRLVTPLVRSEADLERLGRPDPTAKGSRMADRVEGVRRIAPGQEPAESIRLSRYGIELWKQFLMLAALVALAEMAVGRASRQRPGGSAA